MGQGRFSSNSDGTERMYLLSVQEWGLDVKDLLAAVEVTGRSSPAARLRLRFEESASGEPNSYVTTAADIIAVTTISGTLPKVLKGSTASPQLPYLRATLGVSSTGATEEYVDVGVYGGGKPY